MNPHRRAFSPIPRLNTQVGEKSPVRGFHALMLAAAPWPVSSRTRRVPASRSPGAGAGDARWRLPRRGNCRASRVVTARPGTHHARAGQVALQAAAKRVSDLPGGVPGWAQVTRLRSAPRPSVPATAARPGERGDVTGSVRIAAAAGRRKATRVPSREDARVPAALSAPTVRGRDAYRSLPERYRNVQPQVTTASRIRPATVMPNYTVTASAITWCGRGP